LAPAGPFAEISYNRLNLYITPVEPAIIVLKPNKFNGLPGPTRIDKNSALGQFFR